MDDPADVSSQNRPGWYLLDGAFRLVIGRSRVRIPPRAPKPQLRRYFLALLAAQRRRPDPSLGWIIAPAGAPPPLRYVGVRPIDPTPVEALVRRPTPGDIVEDGTIQPALRTGRAFAHPPKPGCGCAALPTVPQVSCRRVSDGQVVCESVAEVDLHRRGQVAGPDQGQHRHRRGLDAGAVPACGIVAAELDAQVDQPPDPNLQQPVTAQLAIGPDRPDDLLVDLALGPRTRPVAQQPDPGGVAAGPAGGPGPAGNDGRPRGRSPPLLAGGAAGAPAGGPRPQNGPGSRPGRGAGAAAGRTGSSPPPSHGRPRTC